MKKLTLYLLVLLAVGFTPKLIAQINTGTASYKLEINGVIAGECCGCCGGVRVVELTLQSGEKVNFHKFNDPPIKKTSWNFDYTLNPFNLPKSLFVRTKNRPGKGSNKFRNINLDINTGTCGKTKMESSFGPFLVVNATAFQVVTYRQVTLVDNSIAFSDRTSPFRINLNSQLLPSHINWQYTSTPKIKNSWKYLDAPYRNATNLSILGNEFLSASDHGKTFYFRNDSGCSVDYDKITNNIRFETTPDDKSRYSNVIKSQYLVSAPNITAAPSTSLKCYDSTNGEVKVTFDRAIKPGETLAIRIVDLDNPTGTLDINGNPTYETVQKIDNLTLLNSGNSFTFSQANNKPIPAGNYGVRLFGFINGFNTFIFGPKHTKSFKVGKPIPVDFSSTKADVFCIGGNDGEILLTANGGTSNYEYQIDGNDWIAFTGGLNHTIRGLSPGTYTIKLRDTNGCVARKIVRNGSGQIIGLGTEEITETIVIEEPDAPVEIDFVFSEKPTAFGFSNGRIRAQITGGTPLADGGYNYTWTHENGTEWSTFTNLVNTDGWFLTLENAIAGTYYLTVTDANHASATDQAGCTIINTAFTLEEPPVLMASIKETKAISCNNTNIYGNPWSDGELTVTATGGVPFNPPIIGQHTYIYTWKKKNTSGVYQIITGENSAVLSNIDTGDYAVNIEDANGVILGTYTNNVLVTATDELITLNQPQLLQVTLTKTELLCNAKNTATATVDTITGGIPPYNIKWSNGQNTAEATNLIAGNYVVSVTDARGCIVTENITIEQPNKIIINILEEKRPTCNQGSDGKIELELSGGTPPYSYSWNTGANNTTSIDNLSQGTYLFSLTDANDCTVFKEIVIEDPDKIVIDLGEDKTLCKDQTYDLDGSIFDADATYIWSSTNGFNSTSPQITISEAGTYTVIATSSLGCIVKDTIVITYSDTVIDSEFLLSSQAYVNQDVVLFNVSNPLGEISEWIIPDNATTINQGDTFITLRFPEVDTYKIGLVSTQGDCVKETYKNIVVEEYSSLAPSSDTKNLFIEEFKLSPNPNNGQFELYIRLAEPSQINIRIFTIQGSFIFAQPNTASAKEYTIPVSLRLTSGVYFMVLETAKQTQVKRMIVK